MIASFLTRNDAARNSGRFTHRPILARPPAAPQASRLPPQSITTTEEPTNQAPQQARQRENVKHLPERLSSSYRNRVSKLSSSYRNPMVKHEPELHRGASLLIVTHVVPERQRSDAVPD